jgi:hypothetical protein
METKKRIVDKPVESFVLFPSMASDLSILYSVRISNSIVLLKRELNNEDEKYGLICRLMNQWFTNVHPDMKARITAKRMEGDFSYNKPHFTSFQLASFLLADATSTWSSIKYEYMANMFFQTFPRENSHNGASIISSGDLLAVTTGINNHFSFTNVSSEKIVWDVYNSGYTLIALLFLDLFYHRVQRVAYDNKNDSFKLYQIPSQNLYFHAIQPPTPSLSWSFVTWGLLLPTIYDDHKDSLQNLIGVEKRYEYDETEDPQFVITQPESRVGIFGLPQYTRSNAQHKTCILRTVPNVAVIFTDPINNSYEIHREQLCFLELPYQFSSSSTTYNNLELHFD